jgi:hypothetical protein
MTENTTAPRAAGPVRTPGAVKFTVALSNCFRLPGEALGDWSKQIKALTAKDKADLHGYMVAAGMDVEAPAA